MIKNTVEFVIDCRGELTGNQYTGPFTAKTKLSLRESLKQDEMYRGILGANSQDASLASKQIASAISYLSTHLMTWPEWWTKLNRGLDCEDVNLLAEVNNMCQEKIQVEYDALAKEAKTAEDLLKAIPGT
jgi:hypothetical protein